MKNAFVLLAVSGCAVWLLAVQPAARAVGSISVYASAPGVSTQIYTGAQIENFNGFAAGAFTTLSSSASSINGATYASGGTTGALPGINANDVYAASTGSGQYLNITPGNTVTLTLASAVPYFGIDVSAVDAGNSFTFRDANGVDIATFNAGIIRDLLPNTAGSTIRAINGTIYNTPAYYGQPNTATPPVATTGNANEPYAYLHFFPQGVLIKSIVFNQSTGGNFENDNHSLLTVAPAVDGTFIAVPEPGFGALVAAGCVGLLAIGRLRRGKW